MLKDISFDSTPDCTPRKAQVIHGDCLEVMRGMESGSVDLTVTSPPYDNLRTYNGYSWDFEAIARELYRVTKDGGVVVWVVGDATIKGSETGSSFRQALYFKDVCGFNLHDTMIFASHKPPLTHRRYEQKFEYMFVLSKGRPVTFNGLRQSTTTPGRIAPSRAYRQRDGHLSPMNGGPTGQTRPETTLRGNIWTMMTGAASGDQYDSRHPAVFPSPSSREKARGTPF